MEPETDQIGQLEYPEREEETVQPEKGKNRRQIYLLSGILVLLLIAAAAIGIRNGRASVNEKHEKKSAGQRARYRRSGRKVQSVITEKI